MIDKNISIPFAGGIVPRSGDPIQNVFICDSIGYKNL